jgi:hypothetical protein
VAGSHRNSESFFSRNPSIASASKAFRDKDGFGDALGKLKSQWRRLSNQPN